MRRTQGYGHYARGNPGGEEVGFSKKKKKSVNQVTTDYHYCMNILQYTTIEITGYFKSKQMNFWSYMSAAYPLDYTVNYMIQKRSSLL